MVVLRRFSGLSPDGLAVLRLLSGLSPDGLAVLRLLSGLFPGVAMLFIVIDLSLCLPYQQ